MDEVPAAFPAVQPMRASLYFDSAEGFGAWKILVGGRATGDLREAKRRSPDFYDIFVKKIKSVLPFLVTSTTADASCRELSNGHFSYATYSPTLRGLQLMSLQATITRSA